MKIFIFILIAGILSISLIACGDNTSIEDGDILMTDDNSQIQSNDETDISSNFKQHSITFPVSDKGKTKFNASIYEIEPFNLSLELPVRWTLKERESLSEIGDKVWLSGVWSVIDVLNENNEFIGAIGYNTYELYEGAEDNPQAIFNQIALGNNYHFDVRESYRIMNETDSGDTAVSNVYYDSSINDGVEKNNKGIVSYNKDFLVYIAIELSNELVTEDEWFYIAKSIEISK